jgi:asparagine synthase (glutamine-hydrolysing)
MDLWCPLDGEPDPGASGAHRSDGCAFATAADRGDWILLLGDGDDRHRDAELVLRHGVDGLHAMDGAFALARWDATRRELIAARDRFGSMTLYWRRDPRGVRLATRMGSLLANQIRRLDLDSALEFLVNGFTDQDCSTLIAGVRQIPAGCVLRVAAAPTTSAAGPAIGLERWYELPAARPESAAGEDPAPAYRSTLAELVGTASRSDRPVGVLLSGGLDSSAVTALAAARRHGPIRTFKVDFGLPLHDQPQRVACVVARTGARHRTTAVGPGSFFEHRDELLQALEHPYERASLAAHWRVCRLMADEGIAVTLDGVGADEQLGGYPAWRRRLEALARGEAVSGLPAFDAQRPRTGPAAGADLAGVVDWLSADVRERAGDVVRRERGIVFESFDELCRHHLRHGALPMLLKYNRDIGAELGLKARSPFMGHRLVELSLRLPQRHKTYEGTGKLVLRRAVADIVPDCVLRNDDKRSYSDIEVAWLRGSLLARLREEAARTASEWPALLDARALARSPTTKASILRLWRVGCFGAWARRFSVEA